MSHYPLANTSSLTTGRRDRIVMAREPCYSPRIRDCSIRQTQDTHYYYSYLSRPMTAAVCNISLMHEIDLSEGGDNPARAKRTRHDFPRPIYNASSACALNCSGAANSCECVRSRAIVGVVIFSRTIFKTQSVHSGFTIRVVDPILLV